MGTIGCTPQELFIGIGSATPDIEQKDDNPLFIDCGGGGGGSELQTFVATDG